MPFSLHEIAIEYRIAARLAPSCEPKNIEFLLDSDMYLLDSLNVVVIESRITSFEDVTNGIIFIKGIADRLRQGRLGQQIFPGRYFLQFLQ